MNLRELSPELAKIAKDELGEDPSRIPADLLAIKEWLSKQGHINARTDDQWLIAFLRGCKYSLERTKEKLDNFYTMKTMVPDITQAFNFNDPKYKEISKLGGNFVLIKPCSPSGPRVVVVRPGRYDASKFDLLDSLRYSNMLSDLLLLEDDNTTVAGQRIIIDLKDVGIGHMAHMTPSNVKKIILTGQDSLPIRQKGTHHINTPGGVEAIFSLIKVFLNEKNKQRIILHNEDMESLYKFIPKEILPTEYGGNGGSIDDMIKYWNSRLESRSEWFQEGSKYRTDESKRPGKPKTTESLFGFDGSFRKLAVD